MTNYNCFVCDGNNKKCEFYYIKPPQDKCTYRYVADNDLKKQSQDNPNTTLTTMLNEYLKLKGDTK